MNEKVKPITITDSEKNETYTLEFDADTVRFAEARGFSFEDVETYPMTKIYELFWLAFRMHHKNMARANTDKLLNQLGGISNLPDGFVVRLGQLWAAAFDSGDEKNAHLTVEM